MRYFGPRPLIEGNRLRSSASTIFNAQLSYRVSKAVRLTWTSSTCSTPRWTTSPTRGGGPHHGRVASGPEPRLPRHSEAICEGVRTA